MREYFIDNNLSKEEDSKEISLNKLKAYLDLSINIIYTSLSKRILKPS